jgi:hypothetical protein
MMLGFLKFNWIKALILISVITAISGTVYGGYKYVIHLQSEISRVTIDNTTLVSNSLNLNQALIEQADTISTLQDEFKRQAQIVNDTNASFEDARDQVSILRKRLSSHEIGFLASERPTLVSNIINNATIDIGRCFEIVSGSPLTTAERNAILPSNINTECPHVANPNYEVSE